jgi:putative ABC transport system permease protein
MLFPVLKVLLGHYRRYPLQFVLVWLGLTLGVSLLIGVTTINHHAQVSYQHIEKLTSNPYPYQIRTNVPQQRIPNSLFEQILSAGVAQCIPFAETKVTTNHGLEFTIIGVAEKIVTKTPVSGFRPGLTKKPVDPIETNSILNAITVSNLFSQQTGLVTGDYFLLQNGFKLGPITVEDNNLVHGYHAAAGIRLVHVINQSSDFSMIACADMSRSKLDQLKAFLGNDYKIKRNYRSELGALTQAFNMNLKAIGLLAFLVGLFIFSQAISLSFIQRQPLVGMLRQAGVARSDFSKAILVELLTFIVISWLCGNVLGLLLANQLLPTVYDAKDSSVNSGIFYAIDWWWCFYSLLLTIVGAVCACFWPLIRLLKSEPIRLTEHVSQIRFAGAEFTFQTVIAIVLGCSALALYHFSDTPAAGLGVVALILISVGFIAPFIVWKSFDFLSYRLKGVRSRWFFADSASSMSYRGIATMAFLIALATNIAAETVVGSFRDTTSQWLEQRLAADLYFYSSPEESKFIGDWLSHQPEVSEVWQRWETEITTRDGLMQVISTGRSEAELGALAIKVAVPDFWYQVHHSQSVLISESTASKLGLRPGDSLELTGAMGENWVVSGIYYDYGNPQFQVLVSDFEWQRHFKTDGDLIVAVVLNNSNDAANLRTELEKNFGFLPERILENNQIYDSVIKVFDKTFSVTQKLGSITLFIAVCGVFVATLAGEVARQRHFTLLRFLGVSGKELTVIGSLQLLTFGVICLAIAIPLGIALAQLIINTSVKSTFGWSIPIDYFSADFLGITLWSLGALVLAGAFPVIRLVLRSPMNVLRNSI